MSAFARSRNPVASPTQPNGAEKGRIWGRGIAVAARARSARVCRRTRPRLHPGASWLHPLHKEVAGGQAGTRPPALCPARRAPDVADLG